MSFRPVLVVFGGIYFLAALSNETAVKRPSKHYMTLGVTCRSSQQHNQQTKLDKLLQKHGITAVVLISWLLFVDNFFSSLLCEPEGGHAQPPQQHQQHTTDTIFGVVQNFF